MSPIELAVRRPKGALTVCACITILGLVAFSGAHIILFPQTRLPVLSITTVLSDADPEEIERTITRPAEDSIADVPGLRSIHSVSRFGESVVTAQFNRDRDITDAALEVRSRIRRLFPTLPKDTRFPVITRYDPSSAPILMLAVRGRGKLEDTGNWVNRVMKPTLSRIDGVAEVRMAGAPAREIVAECDPGRLKAVGLTVKEVAHKIDTAFQTLPAGFLTTSGNRISVRAVSSPPVPAAVAAITVTVGPGGGPITVGSLGEVAYSPREPREITRYNGERLVTAAVFKSSDADTRAVWAVLQDALARIRAEHGTSVRIDDVYNQGASLGRIVRRLEHIVLITAAITALVLYLFLFSVRTTLTVLAALPFSLMVSVLALRALGLPLDALTLSGLALGLGMLVDNAVVAVESVYSRASPETCLQESITRGVNVIAAPIVLSTVTTAVVLIPVVFVNKDVRLYYSGFSTGVAVSLAASLAAALVLVPALLRVMGFRSFRVSRGPSVAGSGMIEKTVRAVRRVHAFRFALVLITLIFIISAALQWDRLSFRADPEGTAQDFRVNLALPPGTSKEYSSQISLDLERKLVDMAGAAGVHAEIWSNQSRMLVVGDRVNPNPSFETNLRQTLMQTIRDPRHVQFHMEPVGQEAQGQRLSIHIQGPDIEKLLDLQMRAFTVLSAVPQVRDVIVRHGNAVPVIELRMERKTLGFRGADAEDVAVGLRSHLTGPVAARIYSSTGATEIRVRARSESEVSLASLQRIMIPDRSGNLIPLGELAVPVTRVALQEHHRMNRRPVITMTALIGANDPLESARAIERALTEVPFPEGFDYSFGRELERIKSTRREMLTAGLLGVILIYLMLCAATESLLQPVIIMTAIPFALGGAVWALVLSGTPVSAPVYIAAILLSGLIVNLNIVMLYRFNAHRREGRATADVVSVGLQERMRPILMTVATTVCAALPLLFDRGTGSGMWGPLAITLAGGMTAGALFSVVITPALYEWVYRRRQLR